MLREAFISIFTLALIALGYFGRDFIEAIFLGQWRSAMTGFLNSFPAIIITIAILIGTGYWLIKNDRKNHEEEKRRHDELINILKDISHKIGGDINDI